ncbi:MAG: hypothetical protein AABX73_03155 [Nanoarchaeota archaeon]|mgnify:CR=1 FL=1
MYYKRKLAQIEEERREALARQDGLGYLVLCSESGIAPEDEFLYERGMTEQIVRENSLPEARGNKYKAFLCEVRASGLNLDNLDEDADAKAGLLKKYFPRFRDSGKQPITNFENVKVGATFRSLANYSRKR